MSEINYYCIRGDKCLFPTMTKEQIVAAIAEATGNTPTSVGDAFISKLKEQNRGKAIKLWIGTQAEYNALTPEPDVCYIFTDGDELSDIEQLAENTATAVCNQKLSRFGKTLYYNASAVNNLANDIVLTIDGLSDYNIIMVGGYLCVRSGDYFSGSHINTVKTIGSSTVLPAAQTYRFAVNGDVLTIPKVADNDKNYSFTWNSDGSIDAQTTQIVFSTIIGIV